MQSRIGEGGAKNPVLSGDLLFAGAGYIFIPSSNIVEDIMFCPDCGAQLRYGGAP